jgi:hypothetical protein
VQVGIPTESAAKRPCYEVSYEPKRSLKDAAPTDRTQSQAAFHVMTVGTAA